MTQCEFLQARHNWPYVSRCKSEAKLVIRPPGLKTPEEDMFVCDSHGVEGVRAGGTKIANNARIAINQARKENGQGKVHAIKLYRIMTGVGLKEALDAINAEWGRDSDA